MLLRTEPRSGHVPQGIEFRYHVQTQDGPGSFGIFDPTINSHWGLVSEGEIKRTRCILDSPLGGLLDKGLCPIVDSAQASDIAGDLNLLLSFEHRQILGKRRARALLRLNATIRTWRVCNLSGKCIARLQQEKLSLEADSAHLGRAWLQFVLMPLRGYEMETHAFLTDLLFCDRLQGWVEGGAEPHFATQILRERNWLPPADVLRVNDPKTLGDYISWWISWIERDAYARDIKELRVIIRRLRTVSPLREQPIAASLKDLSHSLGEIRDIDVAIGYMEAWAAHLDPDLKQTLPAFLAYWEKMRTRRVAEIGKKYLPAHTQNGRYGNPSGTSGMPKSLDVSARIRSWRKCAQLDCLSADLPRLHELRLKGKKLRYTLENVESGVPGESRLVVIKHLSEVQGHLGMINDMYNLQTLLLARSSALAKSQAENFKTLSSVLMALASHEIHQIRIILTPAVRKLSQLLEKLGG